MSSKKSKLQAAIEQLVSRKYINNNVAFKISAILKDQSKYEQQLQKIVLFTPLKAIQWINFNREQITFKTISL